MSTPLRTLFRTPEISSNFLTPSSPKYSSTLPLMSSSYISYPLSTRVTRPLNIFPPQSSIKSIAAFILGINSSSIGRCLINLTAIYPPRTLNRKFLILSMGFNFLRGAGSLNLETFFCSFSNSFSALVEVSFSVVFLSSSFCFFSKHPVFPLRYH